MPKPIYIFIFLSFILSSCHSHKSMVKRGEKKETQKKLTKNIHFYYGGTLTEVIDRAQKENKLVFLDFTASWCAPCQFMEDEIYTYEPLYKKINTNFISYRVDVEKDNGPNIALLYNTKVLPTLIFLDTKGRILVKKEGSAGIQAILDMAQEAMDKSK